MRSEQKRELVISQYKSLGKIEECFRIMKINFNLRPMYVYTDKHIEAWVLICILALKQMKRILRFQRDVRTSRYLLCAYRNLELPIQKSLIPNRHK